MDEKSPEELMRKQLKDCLFRAKIINFIFAVALTVAVILACIRGTAFAGFITCCAASLGWTVMYSFFVHRNLIKFGKKYLYAYLIAAAIIMAVTYFTLYILPKPQLDVLISDGGISWADIMPFIVAAKALADVGIAFNKKFAI